LLYHPLGSTQLEVSAVGFGAATLGDVYGEMSPEKARDTVYHAIDCGINLFDVSPYYGITLAEERLGNALAGRRHEIVLATKCGRYGVDHFDFSAQTVTREFEASLRRLKTDSVDLLQVHDVEFGTFDQIVNETVPALRRLQEQGKARFIGVTGYWPAMLARILEATPVDTVLNYCHSNLLMDDMDAELTPVATRLAVGLINASPLHMGLLSGGTVPPWHPAPAAIKQAAARAVELCRAHGLKPAAVALGYCLARPFVASTLVGCRGIAEVDDALYALKNPPPTELLQELRAILAPVHNVAWPSGLPENQPATLQPH